MVIFIFFITFGPADIGDFIDSHRKRAFESLNTLVTGHSMLSSLLSHMGDSHED